MGRHERSPFSPRTENLSAYQEYSISLSRRDYAAAAKILKEAVGLSHTNELIADVLSGKKQKGSGVHQIENAAANLKSHAIAEQDQPGVKKLYRN